MANGSDRSAGEAEVRLAANKGKGLAKQIANLRVIKDRSDRIYMALFVRVLLNYARVVDAGRVGSGGGGFEGAGMQRVEVLHELLRFCGLGGT